MLSQVSPQELEKQVGLIKASPIFAGAKQLHLFLDLLVNRAVSHNGTRSLTQEDISKALGLREFDSTKPTVRIAAGRLRSRLIEFYATEGRDDSVILEFPKGRPYRLNARHKMSRALRLSGEAFRRCYDGRMLWAQRTPESLEKAAACFKEAIRIDPHSPDPYAALAETYLFMALCDTAPRKVMRLAKTHAEHAVTIDPYNAEAHAALAAIFSAFYWNWNEAEREFERAAQLDSDSLGLYSLRANHLLSVGKTEEAAKDARRILQMTVAGPSPLVTSHAAKILFAAGKYDESEELLLRIREMIPNFYLVHWQLGLLYGTKGDTLTAQTSLEKAYALFPESFTVIAALGWVNALAGKTDRALKIAQHLTAHRKHKYIHGTDLAMIYAALGNMRLAFQWLNRAYRERALFLPWLSVWPPFRSLYCDPQSVPILSKMHLKHPSFSAK
jgi:tetratricopeptide (TPR) repeat protein